MAPVLPVLGVMGKAAAGAAAAGAVTAGAKAAFGGGKRGQQLASRFDYRRRIRSPKVEELPFYQRGGYQERMAPEFEKLIRGVR
jgi:hypothetical protein